MKTSKGEFAGRAPFDFGEGTIVDDFDSNGKDDGSEDGVGSKLSVLVKNRRTISTGVAVVRWPD